MLTRRTFLKVVAGVATSTTSLLAGLVPEAQRFLAAIPATADSCTDFIFSPCWPYGGAQFVSSPSGNEICECAVGPACHDICCSEGWGDGCFLESYCCDSGYGYCNWACCTCGCGCE